MKIFKTKWAVQDSHKSDRGIFQVVCKEDNSWGLDRGFCIDIFLCDYYIVIMYVMLITESNLIYHVPFMFSASDITQTQSICNAAATF